MDSYKTNLQKVLRSVRVVSGFSQQQVAEVLRISRSAYTYYEVGKTVPDVQTLRMLADIYHVPVEVFIFPEKYASEDSAKIRVKPRRRAAQELRRVGDLTEEERQCILRLRMRAERERVDE